MSILAKDHSDPGTYLESVGERILAEVLNRLTKDGSRPYLDPVSYTHLTLPTKA